LVVPAPSAENPAPSVETAPLQAIGVEPVQVIVTPQLVAANPQAFEATQFGDQDEPAALHSASHRVEKKAEAASSKQSFILGLAGSAVLSVGVLAPIISIPIIGTINYLMNGKGDGVIVLVLAGLSALLTLIKVYRGLWATGLLAVGLVTYSFTTLHYRLSQARDEMARTTDDNPFVGLGKTMMEAVQLQWGWAVLLIGGLLLVAAGISYRPRRGDNMVLVSGIISVVVAIALVGTLTWQAGGGQPLMSLLPFGQDSDKKFSFFGGSSNPTSVQKNKAFDESGHRKGDLDSQGGQATGNDAQQSQWIDASKQATRHGDVVVRVTSVTIDFVKGRTFREFSSQEKLLLIRLQIDNVSDGRKLDYKSWSDSHSILADEAAQLTDSLNNRYKRVTFGIASSIEGQVDSESIYPGKSINDLLVFEVPVEKAEYLRLELPAKNFGGTGRIRIQIPKEMIRR
jgi:hypothetical protein